MVFRNSSDTPITRVLRVKNPLLERVRLLHRGKHETITLFDKLQSHQIHFDFSIVLQPHEESTYYLNIQNNTTALRFDVQLLLPKEAQSSYYEELLLYTLFFSVVGILFIYNLVLYFYAKEHTYLLYSIYLLVLIWQQMTYLGLTQMLFSHWLVNIDNLAVVVKVNLLYISAALFAQAFLQTKRFARIHRIYWGIIIVACIEMPFVGTPWFYYPEVAILTGMFFVFFNMFASVYIYLQGYKQARLFVMGWGFQLIGFTLMILDGLGVISIMPSLPEVVMFFTAIEAIVLSLAFVDRYTIVKDAKEASDKKLLHTLQERQYIIEYEIEKATRELNISLANEKNLLKELQHRTKNNLQFILSLIRMQSDKLDASSAAVCETLEGRINTIAKAQEYLLVQDNLQAIEMDDYLEALLSRLQQLSHKEIALTLEVHHLLLPLKEAGYIGLILNELVTNSIKHSSRETIAITVTLERQLNRVTLRYYDNSKEVPNKEPSSHSLGLNIIQTLVQGQLEGELQMPQKGTHEYVIRFSV